MKLVNWRLVWEFVATIVIPFLYLGNILVIIKYPHTFYSTFVLTMLGLIITILGLIIWILSYIHLGKSFGVVPLAQKRIKTGIYKYFNHPMYLGIWLSFLGLSIINASSQGLLYLNLIITPLLFVRANLEERKLK